MGIFPDKPLKKGDRWQGAAKIPSPITGERHDVKYQSVLLGEETFRGAVCQKIKTTATEALSDEVEAPDGSGEARIAGKVTSQETWLFDPVRGIIMLTDGSHRLAFTIKLLQGDEVVERFATSGIVNSRSALTEFNGAAVP